MLDAKHGVPASRSAADSNSYFLGSIGRHNVVIACLPAGSSGAAPAATVAANMQRTFHDVRVSLFVGVGSGAPSEDDDIRLGDVVVGIPRNVTGGVIQFGPASDEGDVDDGGSSGRSHDGGRRRRRFQRTRCLNAPPRSLLSAISVFKTAHFLSEGSWASSLSAQATKKFPRL